MKIVGDNIIFSSGRIFYANCGIIGIDDKLNITQGYDGSIDSQHYDGAEMSSEDRVELADYMIALWTEFRLKNLEK